MRPIAIVLVIAALSTGCALGIKAPRAGAPISEQPACDTGRGGVVADGLFGGILGLGGAAAIADDEVGAGLGLVALGGLMIASAVRGNNAAGACERAEGAYANYVKTLERDRRVAKRRPDPAPAPAPAFTPGPRLPTPTEAATALATGVKPVKPLKPDPDPAAEPDPDPAPAADDDWSAFWEVAP